MARRLALGFRIGASFNARFDPSGEYLITLGRRITLWDVATRQRIATGPPLSHASSASFSPDGRLVAAKNTMGDILVLSVPDLEQYARFSGDAGEGAEIRFARDSQHLVEGTWSGLLRVRDARTGQTVWQEPGGGVFRLACTKDRQFWLYNRWSREDRRGAVLVRRWPFDGHPPSPPLPDVRGSVAVAVSDDALRVAVLARGIHVLERDTQHGDWHLRAHIEEVEAGGRAALAWSPDGSWLAHTGDDAAHVLDVDLRVHHREDLPYNCDVDFSPDGSLLALGDWSAGLVLAWAPQGSD